MTRYCLGRRLYRKDSACKGRGQHAQTTRYNKGFQPTVCQHTVSRVVAVNNNGVVIILDINIFFNVRDFKAMLMTLHGHYGTWLRPVNSCHSMFLYYRA